MVINRGHHATLNRSITAWRAVPPWLTTRTKTNTELSASKETRPSRLTTIYCAVPSKLKTATWPPKVSKTLFRFPKVIQDKFSSNPKWFCNNKSQLVRLSPRWTRRPSRTTSTPTELPLDLRLSPWESKSLKLCKTTNEQILITPNFETIIYCERDESYQKGQFSLPTYL
jgi:hypothetical protein